MAEPAHCQQIVYVRDTYRRTGRGATGFEMHYVRQRCKRLATSGEALCWQHRWGNRLPLEQKRKRRRATEDGDDEQGAAR